MTDTLSITENEIEAVAAKLDRGEALDEYDRVILRGVFVLAGRSSAEAERALDADADVAGFQLGAPPALTFTFTNNLCDGSVRGGFGAGKVQVHDISIVKYVDKASPQL